MDPPCVKPAANTCRSTGQGRAWRRGAPIGAAGRRAWGSIEHSSKHGPILQQIGTLPSTGPRTALGTARPQPVAGGE